MPSSVYENALFSAILPSYLTDAQILIDNATLNECTKEVAAEY